MIRKATVADVEPVLDLIKQFHKESLNEFDVLCNDDVARQVMGKFADTSFILEVDNRVVGVLGGMITTYPLNNNKVFVEWIWYVLPEYRSQGVRLYKRVEEFCKEQGIKQIMMVLIANSMTEKLGEFYERIGFKLLEKHYIKTLEG